MYVVQVYHSYRWPFPPQEEPNIVPTYWVVNLNTENRVTFYYSLAEAELTAKCLNEGSD